MQGHSLLLSEVHVLSDIKKIPGGSSSQTPLDGYYVDLAFEAWAPQFVKHSFPLVSRGVAPYLLCFSNELY